MATKKKKAANNSASKVIKAKVPGINAVKALVQAAEAEKTTLDQVYVITGSNKNISLEIIAGEAGQTSAMTVRLDQTALANNQPGNFSKKVIGTNSDLDGKKLSIVANIADTSKDTDLTSLTIKLKGGKEDQDFPLFKTVSEQGGSEDYLCLIEFFNPF